MLFSFGSSSDFAISETISASQRCKLAAIIFGDVVGYTAIMGRDEGKFERTSRDVLALQGEMAAIAREIDVQLIPREQARLTSARPVNPEAHEAYLKGRYFLSNPSPENLPKALAQKESIHGRT